VRFPRVAIPALLLATTATAQSKPGLACDQTIHSVTTSARGTDSSTRLVHMTMTSSELRIDTEGGGLMSNIGAFSPGEHGVLIMREGYTQLVFLNPDQKQYLTFKPFEMMQGVQKMMESMGGSMVVDTAGSSIHVDSLGPGPTIDGHATLSYRLTTVTRITMSMMGEQTIVENQSTVETQTATDLRDFSDQNTGLNALSDVSQSLGMPKAFFDKMAAIRRTIHGFPLRTVQHTTSSAGGTTHSVTETIEARNVKRLTVPDSLFAIPADYKLVATPGIPVGN
jgi:hypothetical protein